LRTTINISNEIIKETEALYNTGNRSRSIEDALKDAIRAKKLQLFKALKGKIEFDEDLISNIRNEEINEVA